MTLPVDVMRKFSLSLSETSVNVSSLAHGNTQHSTTSFLISPQQMKWCHCAAGSKVSPGFAVRVRRQLSYSNNNWHTRFMKAVGVSDSFGMWHHLLK